MKFCGNGMFDTVKPIQQHFRFSFLRNHLSHSIRVCIFRWIPILYVAWMFYDWDTGEKGGRKHA